MMKIITSNPLSNIFYKQSDVSKGNASPSTEMGIINVYDDCTYQEIIGFGGALTESSAYLYSLLDENDKKEFIESYFGQDGLSYNLGRTHINSCDFSLDTYCYVQEGDETLETFSIERDKKYIIPFIKDVQKITGNELFLFASPWSPPAYMKENNKMVTSAPLLDKYKKTWAKYYAKYVKAFREEGITIGAITIQNEPMAKTPWESCYYSQEDEKIFLEKYLIPTLHEENLDDLKIIIWDHNKERVYDRAKHILQDQKTRERVWAVGHHWYTGDHFDGMRLVHEKLGKMCISTENCCSIKDNPVTVAERYAHEITGNLNNYTSAFCDWNILLSTDGGPFHNRSQKTAAVAGIIFEDRSAGCYAPVLLDTKTKQLTYTPIYYYVGHFSKFVKRGAKRIATTKYSDKLDVCAFKNPDGEIICVVSNPTDNDMPLTLRHNGICTDIGIEKHSIKTIII